MRLVMRHLALLSVLLLLASPALAQKTFFQETGKSEVKDKPQNGTPGKGFLDCSSAIPAMLDNTYSGDTTGGVNQVTTYGCSTFTESGPEDIYVLTLTQPSMFTVDLIPVGVDLDLAVLDACDEDLGCILVADTGVQATSPLTGTFYFVVDGYNGAEGAYDLVFTTVTPPPPVDACATVQQGVPGNEGDHIPSGVFDLSGDTCDSEDHVNFLGCADFTEEGLDEFFEFTLLPGTTIDVTVTNSADGALWILDACAEPWNCLGYADATLTAEPETISYTNSTGAQQTIYLVVDSYGAGSCGSFTGTVTVNPPGVVDTEAASFGTIKSLYD